MLNLLLPHWYLSSATAHLIWNPHVVLRPPALSSKIKNEHIYKTPYSLKPKAVLFTAENHRYKTPDGGHQGTPPDNLEKGGDRRLSDLFPPHNVVGSSQFSRDSKRFSFCVLQTTGSQGAKGGGGEGGDGTNGVAAILVAPPLRARSALRDARFPSPPRCPGPCLALLRWSTGAAPALPWTPEQRRVSVREFCGKEGVR